MINLVGLVHDSLSQLFSFTLICVTNWQGNGCNIHIAKSEQLLKFAWEIIQQLALMVLYLTNFQVSHITRPYCVLPDKLNYLCFSSCNLLVTQRCRERTKISKRTQKQYNLIILSQIQVTYISVSPYKHKYSYGCCHNIIYLPKTPATPLSLGTGFTAGNKIQTILTLLRHQIKVIRGQMFLSYFRYSDCVD